MNGGSDGTRTSPSELLGKEESLQPPRYQSSCPSYSDGNVKPEIFTPSMGSGYSRFYSEERAKRKFTLALKFLKEFSPDGLRFFGQHCPRLSRIESPLSLLTTRVEWNDDREAVNI